MSTPPKDPRSAAERARDTAGIIGELEAGGLCAHPEAEAIHERAARGEITTGEAIELFRQRPLRMEAEAIALERKR
jgi:hypothetical protein